MMSFLNFLFGKKRTFKHPVLGVFTSDRIKGNSTAKTYTWYGYFNLETNNVNDYVSSIFINGNNNTPYSNQLQFITQLIENWQDNYLLEIEQKINEQDFSNNPDLINWQNKFYLSAIYTNNFKSLDFELTLESKQNPNYPTISVNIKNAIILNVALYS
ncbi:hypothetical protein [Cellulophaga omnivescoria]|uniref:hypothetical protein n=1 Tax=Cellulophaga omnivescoria TaxID=1888890 RepID=UPI0022EFFA67|nr:hypothetical protein [Cellulophaga omnivescoria]WBU89770.1 hypothetical protein PBN93_01835 [Cellulophaga omnivescoria]WKB81892.1 hypothetical protein QYR09_02375 [Cellulophaga lytica]